MMAVTSVVSKPTAVPLMMFVAGPVLRRLGDLAHRAERARGVVLRDVDERDARREADDAGEEEPDPDGQAVRRPCRRVFIITYVTNASAATDRIVVTQ